MSFMPSSTIKVRGKGSLSSAICFVGEAPGMSDVKTQEPFSGITGSILTELMHSAGINRSLCYITNVVKEVPKGGKIESFFSMGRGKLFESPEFLQYVQELKEELYDSEARVIVAVGNTALWALCRKIGVTKWRGSILESSLLPGRKIIPIIHPSSAMHNYLYRHYISFDLKRILEESSYPDINTPVRQLVISPGYLDACSYLVDIRKNYTECGCDIEVTNEEVSCISFSKTPTDAISIPFWEGKDYFTVDQEASIWALIAQILGDTNIKKIFQNGIFDMTFLHRKLGIKTFNYEDTMVGQAIMYPDFPKGLDFITSIYTREPYYKDEGKKHFKIGGNWRDFWAYNARDSAVCHEAISPIRADLSRLDNIEIYETQLKLIEPLIYMSERGMRVDVKGRAAESVIADERIKELEQDLWSITGSKINHASPKQLCDYFYGLKNEYAYKNRKTGQVTCDANALKRLSKKGYKEASIIQEIRKYAKNRSTYLEMQLDIDDRIRSSYNPVGTSSLRLSSSKTIFDTGGNTQNLPYGVRKFILADDGYVCYQMDLSQAENRDVAYIAPEPSMMAAFEANKDIHRQTAALIFGKPMDEISDEDGSCPIGGGEHSERFWGKKANHGLNYDLGYKTFAFYYEIPEKDAKFIVERYHTAYPGVRRYHAWVRNQLQKDRTLTNSWGWRRLFLDRWGDTLFKEAYSFIPQSDIASLLNRRGIIYPYFDLKGELEFLNQVHDSIWFQIPLTSSWERHAWYLKEIRKSLEQPIKFRAQSWSIPVDTEMGFNFGKWSDKKGDENVGGLYKLKFNTDDSIESLAKVLETTYNLLRPKMGQSGS